MMDIDKFAAIIRSMNEHEDKLKDQRIRFLISAQAILFAAIGLVWAHNLIFILIISILGIAFAWVIRPSLLDGELAGEELRRVWWERQKIEVEMLKEQCDWPPALALEYRDLYDKGDKDKLPLRFAPEEDEEGNAKQNSPKKSDVSRNIIYWVTAVWSAIFLLALSDLYLACEDRQLAACKDRQSECKLMFEIQDFFNKERSVKE